MNNIGTIHLKDSNFELSTTETSELLIKVSATRLSYAIINEEKQVIALYDSLLESSLTEKIDELVTEYSYLKSNYKNVKVQTENFHFTFIPELLYAENNQHIYKSLFAENPNDEIVVNHLRKAGIMAASTLQTALTETLLEYYPEAKIYSQAEPLIDGIMHNYQGDKLILQFTDTSFEFLLLENQTVKYYNIFSISNADDFNYYLLFALQQLALTGKDFEVVLTGDISKEDEIYARVAKYYSKISFASNIRIARLSTVFSEIPEHQFFTLFNLFLCE